MFDWNLVAGIPDTWYGEARYFRLLSGDGDLEIRARYKTGSGVSSKILSGVGVDLSNPHTSERFEALEIKSEIDQVVRVLVSEFPTTDGRLSGDVYFSGGNRREFREVAISAGVATLILPEVSNRLKSSVRFSCAGRMKNDNTVSVSDGLPFENGGMWEDKNTAELWVYSVAGGSVSILEDFRL